MRLILMALALGISISAIASPALAEPSEDKVDRGIEKVLAQSDSDAPQLNVGVVAGSDEPHRPAWLEQRYENMEGQ
jgi:hypothetical protein